MNLKRDEKDFFKWLEEKGMKKDTFIRYSRYGGIVSRPAINITERGSSVFEHAITGARKRGERVMVIAFEELIEKWDNRK